MIVFGYFFIYIRYCYSGSAQVNYFKAAMQGDGGLESAWICYNLLLVYRFDRRHQAF